MLLKEATALLQHKSFHPTGVQKWADLGCGSGLFTLALAGLLQDGSTVYAVDNNSSALKKIPSADRIGITPVQADFITAELGFKDLDGILMANSFHYVKDKSSFIARASRYLKPGGCFLMIEYDTDIAVPTWVPYPVSFRALEKLFGATGFTRATKLQEQPSVYNKGNLYAALLAP